eukprot:TRINITY_DN74_c0_g4_i4.p1 TRINITY_DN74_c0_g4~~TRINITY_DN74_c0_g4_i4.p1  ORF type:complete len:874 (-),score=273.77 TRINITY_DN74_c0_g4_i4:669-3290(-)
MKSSPRFEYPSSPQKAAELFRTTKLNNDLVAGILGDPDIRHDKLPMPYRLVDKIVQQILCDLNNRITAIDQRSNTPSYEGHLKDLWATGALEINGITAISTESNTRYLAEGKFNRVIVGDKTGTIYLIDCARKLLLTKAEAFQGRRITGISIASIAWLDTHLVVVAVCARGSGHVSIFFYKNNESKLFHYYRVKVAEPAEAQEDTVADGYPRHVKVSADGLYVAVTLCSGEVLVLEVPPIPEPTIKREFQEAANQLQLGGKKEGKSSLASLTAMYQSDPSSLIDGSIECEEPAEIPYETLLVLKLPVYTPPKFVPKEVPTEEPPVDPKVKKKEAKKEQKKEIKKGAKKEEKKEEEEPGKPSMLFGPLKKDEEEGDISPELPHAEFAPVCFFVQSSKLFKADGVKGPQAIKMSPSTTSLIVVYTGSYVGFEYLLAGKDGQPRIPKDFSLDKQLVGIIKMKPKNIPKEKKEFIEYVNEAFQPKEEEPKKKADRKQEEQAKKPERKAPDPKRDPKVKEEPAEEPVKDAFIGMRKFEAGKTILAADYTETSESDQLLALGLCDGTVVIYDIAFGYPKAVIQKLNAPVSTLAFNGIKHLIVGYSNGYVVIFKKDKDWPSIMQARVHQDLNYPVIAIYPSEIGICIACDSEGNARLFDLYRGKKIGKLCPLLKHSSQPWTWRLFPQICLSIQKDTIIAVSSHADPLMTERLNDAIGKSEHGVYCNGIKSLPLSGLEFSLNTSVLFLFRIEDLLLAIYPAIASMNRPDLTIGTLFENYDETKKPEDMMQALEPTFKSEDISSIRKSPHPSHKSSQMSKQDQPSIIRASKAKQEDTAKAPKKYGAPTIELLNPELYKQRMKYTVTGIRHTAYDSIRQVKDM